MSLQILQTFKNPAYVLMTVFIVSAYGLILFYFDQFVFFSPYLVAYMPPTGLATVFVDMALSFLTGMVLTVSIYVTRFNSGKANGAAKTGLFGMITAVVAGACPCYYLFTLLVVAGGIGGTIGAVAVAFNNYAFELKIISLGILLVSSYSLEHSLRRTCKVGLPT